MIREDYECTTNIFAKVRFSVYLVLVAIWTLILCYLVYSAYISTNKMRCAMGCGFNGAPLHRFPDPVRFPEKFKAWVEILGATFKNPEDHLQFKRKRICGIHFKVEERNRNNRLNNAAVPSLHLPMWCNKPWPVINSMTTNIESTSSTGSHKLEQQSTITCVRQYVPSQHNRPNQTWKELVNAGKFDFILIHNMWKIEKGM